MRLVRNKDLIRRVLYTFRRKTRKCVGPVFSKDVVPVNAWDFFCNLRGSEEFPRAESTISCPIQGFLDWQISAKMVPLSTHRISYSGQVFPPLLVDCPMGVVWIPAQICTANKNCGRSGGWLASGTDAGRLVSTRHPHGRSSVVEASVGEANASGGCNVFVS